MCQWCKSAKVDYEAGKQEGITRIKLKDKMILILKICMIQVNGNILIQN